METIQKIEKNKNHKGYLNFEERQKIEKMLLRNISGRKIATILGRGKSTIYDEVKRYSTHASGYEAILAERQFQEGQARKGNISKIEGSEVLKTFILKGLDLDWSPEEISGRIKLLHSDPDMDNYVPYVCHETIYCFLYAEKNKHLKLYSKLRRHRRKRILHGTRRKNNVDVLIKNRVSITERDNIIEKKERVGDFESDSVVFPGQKHVLNTNICRVTRLARFELVKDKTALSSISVQKHIVYEMEELGVRVYSFTFDNGGENALHEQLHSLGVQTYFCDPYCSYQKGAIENLNMFIRQYLPRCTDVSTLTATDIHTIQEKLNNRPRKCLGYLSPNECFYKKTGVKPN